MLMVNHLNGFNARTGSSINLVISTNQVAAYGVAGYNVFTSAGSPAGPVAVTLTINSGVTVTELRAQGFANGSTLHIINNGDILGNGGSAYQLNAATAETPGTAAIITNVPTTITNNGNIWGGGGAGGFSGYAAEGSWYSGAAGGGGGQGYNGGLGSAYQTGFGSGYIPGGDASNGSISGAGTGGTPGESGGAYYSGFGGNGGTWGQPGTVGTEGYIGAIPQYNQGAASAGGAAVSTGGKGLTWLAGNNATQVKGAAA